MTRGRFGSIARLNDGYPRTSQASIDKFCDHLKANGVPVETQLMLAGQAAPLAGSRSHYVVPIPSKEQVEVGTDDAAQA